MTEQLTPDFPATDFDKHATAKQHDAWWRLSRQNWVISHLWQPKGHGVIIWCITIDGHSQGYIEPQGQFVPYHGQEHAS
jgi:hypothetical protein